MLPLLFLLAAAQVGAGPSPPQGVRPVEAAATRSARADSLLGVLRDRRRGTEERMLALEELARLRDPLPLEPLLDLRTQVRRTWLPDYVRCLGRTGPGAIEPLGKYLKSREPEVRAEAVYALTRLDEAGGESLARSVLRDSRQMSEARVAALRGLADRGSLFARVEAIRRLATAEGPLLLEAIATLRRKPDAGDIPYLIDVLEERQGRAANEAVRLLQEITGYRIGRDARSWKYWMLKHEMEATPFRREPLPGEENPGTLSYMGVPIYGEKVAFVLDSSGSMNTVLPEQRRETRGMRALRELIELLPRLPRTAEIEVIFFSGSVHAYGSGRLVPREEDGFSGVLTWLERHHFEGGTNLAGGLEGAFSLEGVEEIILLSDGEPTVGLTNTSTIRARTERWNRWRNVRINTVSLGAPPAARNFLARLALGNDGVCRVIN